MGHIACLCNEDLMDTQRFGFDFEDMLSLDCEWQFFGSPAQLTDALSTGFNPQVVMMHLDHCSHSKIRDLIEGLRNTDPELCLVLLSAKELSKADTMDWLDLGVNGVMKLPFDPLLVSDPLVEVLKKKLSMDRLAPRVQAKSKVEIHLASLEQGVAAETLNISCTGMFLSVNPENVRVGEQIEFSITLSDENLAEGLRSKPIENPIDHLAADLNMEKRITGHGEIVWIRQRAEGDQPAGIAIKFLDMEQSGMETLRAYIAKRRLGNMVPEGV